MPRVIVFLKDNYISKAGTCPVVVKTYIKGKRCSFNTGVKIPPGEWDAVKLQVRNSCKDAGDYNLIIKNCVARVTDIFVRYRLQHMKLTPELLLKEYATPSTSIDFYNFMAKAIADRKGEIVPATARHHNAVLNKLKDFQHTLTFAEIDKSFIDRYRRFLKNNFNNDINTVHSNLKCIKTYLNIAVDNGVIRKNPFDDITLKRVNPDRVFLDEQELEALVNKYKQFSMTGYYQQVLELFLFSCFTGLRISDVRNFKWENIIKNIMVVEMVKTRNVNRKVAKVPISPMARAIIDNQPRRRENVFCMMPTDQAINRTIKLIAADVGIKKKITFHCARHTFATIFLRRTKNVAALQKILGHTNIRETMIYAHVLTEDIENEMKCFDDF